MTRLPSAVDELRGLRAARWVRESTAGQYDRNGPEAQRRMQVASMDRLGLVDTGLVWEPAHSGATVYRSRAMAAMLDAAGAGAFDVLVVAYTARWQRNLRQTLNVLEDQLHPIGVAVWFVDEEILSSNDRHWDALVDSAKGDEAWLRKHRKRVREGLAAKLATRRDPGGHPPYGFRRNAERLVEPDPERLTAVLRAFSEAAAGRTDREVAASTGLPLFTVRGMLTSPLYVGRLRDGGPARWAPVVDAATWEAVQAHRARRSTNSGRPADPRRPYALSMLRCMACGVRLTGDTGYYRHRDACQAFLDARPAKRRGSGSGYRQGWYEGIVEHLLERAAVDEATIAAVVGELAAPSEDALALARIARERDAALARYVANRDAGALEASMRRLDAEEAVARQPEVRGADPSEVVAALRELPRLWRDAPATRPRLAAQLFDRIEVLGFRTARAYTTGTALALGLASLVPVSCSVPVSGRGERSCPRGIRLLRCRLEVITPQHRPIGVVRRTA